MWDLPGPGPKLVSLYWQAILNHCATREASVSSFFQAHLQKSTQCPLERVSLTHPQAHHTQEGLGARTCLPPDRIHEAHTRPTPDICRCLVNDSGPPLRATSRVVITKVYNAFSIYKGLLCSSSRLVPATTSKGVRTAQTGQGKPRDVR